MVLCAFIKHHTRNKMKSNFSNLLQIIRELNYILNRKQKGRMILVLLTILISSLLELLGVTAIVPFIQAVVDPERAENYWLAEKLIYIFDLDSASSLLLGMGIGLIFIYIFKNLYMIFSYYMQYAFSSRIQMEISNNMLESYMRRPYEYYLDINSSEVLRGCTGDINGVYAILSDLLQILTEVFTILLIGTFLFVEDFVIAVGVLIVMAIVSAGIVFGFKPIMKKIGRKYREIGALKSKTIFQMITGIKEIYVMQKKKFFIGEYKTISEMERKISKINGTISNSPDRITEGVCVSGIIGIVCIRLVVSPENMSNFVPVLGAFAMAAFKLFPSIGKISSRLTDIVYYRACLANVYQNVKETNGSKESQIDNIDFDISSVKQKKVLTFKKSIIINHVEWKYKNQTKAVLEDVSITIEKGESVGFIGVSGAGKTTLLDIILGLLLPQRGAIMIDGIDISTVPEMWADIVGYVPQAVFLLDDTIRNNIAFGIPKSEIDDDDIWEALRQAQLKEFIESLPDGLETVVGERGIRFSGGQKQRIAIARALYHKPEILILDEATAALDMETETAVMEAIDSLQGKLTLIIVAHRLNTIQNCDTIYEIVEGRAVVKGKNL